MVGGMLDMSPPWHVSPDHLVIRLRCESRNAGLVPGHGAVLPRVDGALQSHGALFLRTSASNSLLGGAMGADSICRAAFSIAGRSRQSGQAAPFSRAPDSWTLVDRRIARTAEQQAVPSFPLTSEFLSCLQIEPWVQISTPT